MRLSSRRSISLPSSKHSSPSIWEAAFSSAYLHLDHRHFSPLQYQVLQAAPQSPERKKEKEKHQSLNAPQDTIDIVEDISAVDEIAESPFRGAKLPNKISLNNLISAKVKTIRRARVFNTTWHEKPRHRSKAGKSRKWKWTPTRPKKSA